MGSGLNGQSASLEGFQLGDSAGWTECHPPVLKFCAQASNILIVLNRFLQFFLQHIIQCQSYWHTYLDTCYISIPSSIKLFSFIYEKIDI